MNFGRANEPRNLVELLEWQATQSHARVAYKYSADGGWGSMTWSQVATRVREIAATLINQGVNSGDRVAIMSSTRIEWALTALAILSVGAAVVAIYPQTKTDGIEHIITDSGATMCIVENQELLESVLAGSYDPVPDIVLFDDDAQHRYPTLRSLLGTTNAAAEAVLAQYQRTIGGETLATLIYTSGTTGSPKGVMLTHGNWLAEAQAIAATRIVNQDDVEYCWLPFSHSFGMALLFGHVAIGFTKFIDGNPAHIVANLKEIQPTFMAGPPRTFEKIAAGVKQRIQDSDWLTRTLYAAAMRSAEKWYDNRRPGDRYRPPRVGVAPLVFKKLSESFGGKLRLFVSGGAALDPDIAKLFDLWGTPILAGYGLSETCGASVVGRYEYHPVGSVGWPLPDTEVMIAPPVDNPHGEILLRGPHVMRGYYGDTTTTARVLDPDGWLHTGDLGRIELGPDGQPTLYVTGRIKDACKLSSGKYVSPEQIEIRLTATGMIAHAVVVAEGRKFVSALVSLDPDTIRQWAERQGLDGDYRSLAKHPRVREMVRALVDNEVNTKLEHWEQVVGLSIVPEQFNEDNGYLTPSNKVRRHQVLSAFAPLVVQMYA